MTDISDNIPKDLKDALRVGKVIPFIGAGLSRAIEKKEKDLSKEFDPLFPDWGELIEILADALIEKGSVGDADYIKSCLKLTPRKYLEAMLHAKSALKDKNWYQILDKELNLDKDLADEAILEATGNVWNLGSNLLITTNIDKVLQWNCPSSNPPRILDTQTVEYGQLQKEHFPQNPTVWHLHGYIDNKEGIIFTEEQYKDFYDFNKHEAKLKTLLSFLSQHTFLFIGFSLDDPYFIEQIKYLQRIYKNSVGDYYVLFKKGTVVSNDIKDLVEIVEYDTHGKPFLEKLKQLSAIAQKSDDSKEEIVAEIATNTSSVSIKDEKKPFFNVPFPTKGDGFIGRKEKLEEIHNSLKSGKPTHIGQAQNIQGLGGLGKTQLAVEYAHYFQNQYQNGVYWITADAGIENELIKIGREKKWIFQEDKSINQFDVAKERFLDLKDCLVIFDNVESINEIKLFLPKDKLSVHLLITSRLEQDGFKPISLETLSDADAKELLLYIAERNPKGEAETKAFDELIKELDGLPLAIELVGGYLAKRTTISFGDYLNHFKSESLDKIESRFPKAILTKEDVSIIKTLTISKDFFDKTPYLQDILDILAWSGGSSMGISLLQALVKPNNEFEFRETLDVAFQLKLLKKDTEIERYAIHRLLGRVRQLERPFENNLDWLQSIAIRLGNWFDERANRFENLQKFEAEAEHLEKWQEQVLTFSSKDSIKLTQLRGNIPNLYGNYQIAHEIFVLALNLYKENSFDNKRLLSSLYSNLGSSYGNLGNYKQALEYQKKALTIDQELFGDNHPETAISYSNIGATYNDLGNHRNALEYHEKALEILKKLFKDNHPETAISYGNIGATYNDLGNHQKALEYQEKALFIIQKLFGDNHPDTASSYNNIGATYNDLGNHQKALEYQIKALSIRHDLFGDNNPITANSYYNLGLIYKKLKNNKEAFKYFEKAFNIFFRILGNRHPITKLIGRNYVCLLRERMQTKLALEIEKILRER